MPYPASGADLKVEIVNALGGAADIQGTVTDGASASGVKPVIVGGVDGSSNAQTILVDTSGRQEVLQRSSGITLSDALSNSPQLPINPAGTTQINYTALGYVHNATTWDRKRSATAAANTTGTGLLGIANLNFDSTNYQRAPCDTTGTPRIGYHATTFKVTPTVQAAAYATGDVVGGKQSVASFTRIAAGATRIKAILISDNAANSAANLTFDVIFFDSDPAATTFTENSALTLADADLDRVVGIVAVNGTVGTHTAFVDNSAVVRDDIDKQIQLAAANTTLYFCLIVRGGPTFAATTDLQVTFLTEPN